MAKDTPPAPELSERERERLLDGAASLAQGTLGYRRSPAFMQWFEAVLPAASPKSDQ